jgi:uncharacterized damage-inducible protein DinB
MQENAVSLADKLFEFNLWANTQLIDLCAELDGEQLAVQAEGVYGNIQPTLAHIIRAEGGYIWRLTGARPWGDDVDWENMPLSELRQMAQLSGGRLIEIAAGTDLSVVHEWQDEDDSGIFFNWTVLIQAFYHGVEHRTQVKILLTKLGIPHSDLSVWDFTDALTKA